MGLFSVVLVVLAGLFGLVVCCVKLRCLGWVPIFWSAFGFLDFEFGVLVLMVVFILFCVCLMFELLCGLV